MRTLLNTKFRTLTVYLVIHASMSLQFKVYSPKFTNKLFPPAILPFLKLRRKETHGAVHNSISKPPPKNLTSNLAKKWFLKNRMS